MEPAMGGAAAVSAFHQQYLTSGQAAEYLGLSKRQLSRYRSEGRGPAFYWVGSEPRYDRGDLDSWIRAMPRGGGGRAPISASGE